MKCPICSNHNDGQTVNALATHLRDAHRIESFRAGRLAQLARDWVEYEVQNPCGAQGGDRQGALAGACC